MADPYAVYRDAQPAPKEDPWAEFKDDPRIKPGSGGATVDGQPLSVGQEQTLAAMGGINEAFPVGTDANPRWQAPNGDPGESGTWVDRLGRVTSPQREPISQTMLSLAMRALPGGRIIAPPSGRLDAFQSALTSGLLLGGKNEAMAGAAGLGAKLRGGDFGQEFQNTLGLLDTQDADLRERYPAEYYGGGAFGAVASAALAPEVKGFGLAGKVAGDALTSGVSGFLSADGTAQERLPSALTGAAMGAGGSALLRRVPKPKAPTPQQILMDQGVRLPPGMAAGGALRNLESMSTSVPILGGGIKKAEQTAVEDLNRVAIDRTLEPVGLSLPKDVPVGFDAVKYADDALSDVYDQTLGPLTIAPDQQFTTTLNDIKQLADELPDDIGGPVTRSIERRLENLFQGPIDGPTFKKIDGDLARKSRQFNRSDDPFKQDAGDIYDDLRVALREVLERSNPQAAERLRAANKGFANLVRVQRAARRSPNGVFSPAQLHNAVLALDGSARGKQASMSGALMQDLSAPAAEVMKSYPDSGTAGRVMAIGGAPAAVAGAFTNPIATGASLLGLGAGRMAYSSGAAALLAKAAARAGKKVPHLWTRNAALAAKLAARGIGPALSGARQ